MFTLQKISTSSNMGLFYLLAAIVAGLIIIYFVSKMMTSNTTTIAVGSREGTASSSVEKFNGTWIVQKVTDINIADFDDMRFDFVGGTLYGSGPCRSFKTTFGPDTQNMMFTLFELGGGGGMVEEQYRCSEHAMTTEREFFRQIEVVNRMEIEDDGSLVMYNFEKPLLWAKRIVE